MSNSISRWILEMVDKVSAPLVTVQTSTDNTIDSFDSLGKSIDNAFGSNSNEKISSLGENIGKQAFLINQTIEAVGKFKDAYANLIAPGAEFESQMAELSAVTQKTGKDLAAIGDGARNLAKEFGGSASQQVDAFKGIIARFGPAVADSDVALESMGRSVATLSKLMDGDAKASMDALTTAMLQYGVDLTNPIEASKEMARIMNILVAGGNEGASEVTDTADALKVAGLIAKQSGVGIESFTSAMQALATGSLTGAEAGTKFRNVLMNMASESMIPKETVKALKAAGVNMKTVTDSTLPLTDRLRELRKVSGSDLIMQMFGMNTAAAEILMDTAEQQDEWTKSITGTNAAAEGAKTIMGTFAETMSRINAKFEDWKIKTFNATKAVAPFISITGDTMTGVTDLGVAVWGLGIILKKDTWTGISIGIKAMTTGIKGWTIWTKIAAVATTVWTSAQKLLDLAFATSPIGWVVLGVGALAGGIALLWNKCEGFRAVVLGLWEVMKGFGTILKDFIIDRITGFLKGIGALGEAIYKLFTGDFKGAWASAKEGVSGILPFGALNNAYESAKGLGEAYEKGAADGRESFRKSQAGGSSISINPYYPEGVIDNETPYISTPFKLTPASTTISADIAPVGDSVKKKLGGGTQDKNKLDNNSNNNSISAGSGGGSGKSVTMNLTLNNYFSGVKNPDEVAEIVVRKINDRLNDSLAAVG